VRVSLDPCVGQIADWIAEQGHALTPQFDQAQRFLQALDPGAESFSFRTFSDTPYTRLPGRDPMQLALHGTLTQCWTQLVGLNQRGAAVSVTINRTNGRGRAAADIEEVRALFLDDDDPPQNLDRFPLSPHIQVQTSPGRFHHYWLVDELPLFRFSEYQRRLALRYGGDNKVMALNQSMQLPGFWRRKNLTRPLLPGIQHIKAFQPYRQEYLEVLLVPANCAVKEDVELSIT
jgi:hypothetical protein